jgi:xylulokinase
VLVVGLDLGTQSCKAVVCDEQLAVRGTHAIPYGVRYPAPDHAEQDPATWDAALAPAIAGALAAAGASAADVAAVAISGQLDGCVAVDANGAAIHPALIWQDKRATAETCRVDAKDLFARTGQVADASHMAPKIRWLRKTAAARFHQPVSYLVERLCGEAVIDPALASTTMLLSLATRTWDPELLAAFEIARHELPRLAPTCAIAGQVTSAGAKLTGLFAGTPVAVGTGDDFCTPLGAGVVAPARLMICAIGTAEVAGTLAASAVLDGAAEPMVETHVYPSSGPSSGPTGAFFVENPGWLAGGAVRWAQRVLGIADDRELDALAASAPPGADGVTFIPALTGAMTPVWRAHARGAFYGLAAQHERPHLARAVLEGLAFASRDVCERLAAMQLPTDRVLLLGGGSRSETWAQIRADALGKRHDVAWSADTCPVGAAMIAAVAAGMHRDLAACATLLPPPRTMFTPRASLDAAYARYQQLVSQLAPLASAPWAPSV